MDLPSVLILKEKEDLKPWSNLKKSKSAIQQYPEKVRNLRTTEICGTYTPMQGGTEY